MLATCPGNSRRRPSGSGGDDLACKSGDLEGGCFGLSGGQVESLFDLGLPVEVRELPADLAALDVLLADPALLGPIERAWEQAARGRGRPTIAMTAFVRLMVVKQRSGWGYETLVREVSDSLHLRRFCRIALTERVPDESTVRKLVRRLGAEVIEEISRAVIAQRDDGRAAVRGAGGADRLDGRRGRRSLSDRSRAGRRRDAALAREAAATGRGRRGRAAGPGPLAGGRPAAAQAQPDAGRADRAGQADRAAADRRGRRAGRALGARGAALGRAPARRARGRGAQAKLAAARRLEELADRAGKVARQIRQRAGRREDHRPARLASPTPTRGRSARASCAQPTEFGYVIQLAELCENTRRGARGLILPAASQIGSPNESDLLPATAAELDRLGLRPREVALDGGFAPIGVAEHLPDPQRVFIAGRQSAGSRRTDRRLARFRVGSEGRISHLKRRYGLRRSRLKGHHGARTWTAWAILAYNLDTLAIRAA